MSIVEIGCCGAYCKTCKVLAEGACRGCKLGYDTGERDLSKAKCKAKVCCMTRKYGSCAECPDLAACATMGEFFGKKCYKYGKYRESIEFIRDHGYVAFFEKADGWTGAYGKLK
jgi:hypothetical protein